MPTETPFVLLQSRAAYGGASLYRQPTQIITADAVGDVAAALESVHGAIAGGCHAAGYVSYELGYALESRLASLLPASVREPRPTPLLWFGLFRERLELDETQLAKWLGRQIKGRAYAGPLHFELDRAAYGTAFRRAKEYLLAGDIYQVNLTIPARFSFLGDPLALYADLRARAAAPHAAYVDDGSRSVLSLSPEQFFSIRDGVLTARPMKGTAPRGANPDSDLRLKNGLAASDKDRAENLMIVDLIRNDLGRVAQGGSVGVEDMYAVETYPTVHQMVSTVTGRLRQGAAPRDLVTALFPCGSVTGTPKIRAQQIIRELEPGPRGVYCGAIGHFAPDGSADFNVAIRTLTITGKIGRLGVGSAIVVDSTETGEYEECLLKSRFFSEGRQPISLIETLRFEPAQGLVRGTLHLERMEQSAAALGIPFDRAGALALTKESARDSVGPSRVRLVLDESGRVAVSCDPIAEPGLRHFRYAISPSRVSGADLLARHKTGWRTHYDQEFQRLNTLLGCDQVIFVNERDELVEGNGTNIFVRRGKTLVTPPLSSGALAGCLRRTLIESGDCVEGVLRRGDLKGEVYLGNSLRGLLPAVPVQADVSH